MFNGTESFINGFLFLFVKREMSKMQNVSLLYRLENVNRCSFTGKGRLNEVESLALLI